MLKWFWSMITLNRKERIEIIVTFILGFIISLICDKVDNFIYGWYFEIDYFFIVIVVLTLELGAWKASFPYIIGGFLYNLINLRLFLPSIKFAVLFLILIVLISEFDKLMNENSCKGSKYRNAVYLILISLAVYMFLYPLFFSEGFPNKLFGYKEVLMDYGGILFAFVAFIIIYFTYFISEISGLFDNLKEDYKKEEIKSEDFEEMRLRIKQEIKEEYKNRKKNDK